MTKGYIKIIMIITFSVLSISCRGQSYYKKVRDNIEDFTHIINRLNEKQMLEPNDSILLQNAQVIKHNNKCLYKEHINDPLISDFMRKYDLNRICFSKYNNEFFDSVITFHKEHALFFGKAIVITDDFGNSGLRDMANQKLKVKDEKVKIINDIYLYRVKSNPSFGE